MAPEHSIEERPDTGLRRDPELAEIHESMPAPKPWGPLLALLPALVGGACAEVVRPVPPPAPSSMPGTPTSSAAASAATSARPAPSARPQLGARAPDGDIGTAAPLVVEAVARDGGWVVFCQAREDTDQDGKVSAQATTHGTLAGDLLQRYLARAAGSGERIDELLAADGSGRWVVVGRSGVVSLIDTQRGVETNLSALGLDARGDSLSFRAHRALAFDPSGERLAYIRGEGADARVAVRTLATGAELVLDPGGGDLWRIEIEPTARFVVAYAMLDDTNRDKKISWPVPVRKAPPACRSPISTYDAWVGRGDEPVVRLLPLGGGGAETVPGFVSTLGDGVVVREPGGRLVLRVGGKSEELSGDKCGARVVLVDHAKQQLLVACTKPKGRPKLQLVLRGEAIALDTDVAHQSQDQVDGTWERLFALYPGSDTKLLDLGQRRLITLSPSDVVLASLGPRALIRRRGGLLVVDVEHATEHALDAKVAPTLDTIAEPPWVAAAPVVVSLATGRVLGSFSGRPLAVAPDGKVLVARGADADGDRLAVGPLIWRTPTPIASAH